MPYLLNDKHWRAYFLFKAGENVIIEHTLEEVRLIGSSMLEDVEFVQQQD